MIVILRRGDEIGLDSGSGLGCALSLGGRSSTSSTSSTRRSPIWSTTLFMVLCACALDSDGCSAPVVFPFGGGT
ncbi:uncharacterized protein BDV17DRAFT_248314 [Aspergillus undulatus]|uniref:uncharacterized protein n=1 Tax=Aspergillus undulatus TaxID=1810928 RepID=UPI003CCCFC09